MGKEAKSIKVRVPVELGPDFVSDVLITAFDGTYGACWTWCSPVRENYLDEAPTGDADGDTLWTECRVRVHENLSYEPPPYLKGRGLQVNADIIAKGLQAILYGCEDVPPGTTLHDYISRGVREKDAGDIDAIGADVIVQMGLFGRVQF